LGTLQAQFAGISPWLLSSGTSSGYQPHVGASADALAAFYDGDRTI
jgi:hypothetical protein